MSPPAPGILLVWPMVGIVVEPKSLGLKSKRNGYSHYAENLFYITSTFVVLLFYDSQNQQKPKNCPNTEVTN